MEVVKRRMMMRSKKMREMKNLKSVNLLLLKVEARCSLLYVTNSAPQLKRVLIDTDLGVFCWRLRK